MHGRDAAGLSSFEARPAVQDEHIRMTVRHGCAASSDGDCGTSMR